MTTPDIRLTRDEQDFHQILDLQARNHRSIVPEADKRSQGYVTIKYSVEQLRRMHDLTPHVVAERDGKLVGYAIALDRSVSHIVPDLQQLLALIDQAAYQAVPMTETKYLIMGQVCVDATARGHQLVDRMYAFMAQQYAHRYQMLVTEVATANTRSIRVHERCGFQELFRHHAHGQDWVTIVWPW